MQRNNEDILNRFISSKEIEGCSIKTLNYYKDNISKMFEKINLPICEITTETLRNYLSDYKSNSNAGMVTIDNMRRVLSSFFAWLENEDYIVKSPVRRIHKVKATKKVKETLTDENLEKLRDTCSNVRDLAILELLISTGMRVGELTRLNISDMNFQERSCIVLGKGNTEREVYFSAAIEQQKGVHSMKIIQLKENERIEEGLRSLTEEFIGEYPYYSTWIQKNEKTFQDGTRIVYELNDAGKTVGYMMIHFSTDKCAKVNGIYVFPDCQKKGYAK